MKICLAVPSIQDFYFSQERVTSLGALTVSRLLEESSHTCVFFDFPKRSKKGVSVELPVELSYLKPFLLSETGPMSFFTRYQRLGPHPRECARSLVAADPDIVLLSCFAYGYAGDTLDLAREIKVFAPQLPIAVGGAGATVLPETFLRSGCIEFVLLGEAEVNLRAFLDEFSTRGQHFDAVPNLAWREDGSVRRSAHGGITTEDDLLWVCRVDNSRRGRTRLSTMLTRGCPRRCSFCSNHLCHGRRFRKLSLEQVATGLSGLPPCENMHINFEDDNLLADQDYCTAVLDLARRRFGRPTFSAENGLDAGFLNEELLEKLVLSGFSSFNFSLGSIDTEILRQENRSSMLDRVTALTQRCASLGVPSVTYFICGLPGDTPQTVARNLLFLHSLPTRIGISLFYPVPGLPGFENPEVFLATAPRLSCGSSAYPWNGSLSTRRLVTAFRLARFLNLLCDPRARETHAQLLRAIMDDGRLYTWSGNRRQLMPVSGLDDDLVRHVLGQVRC